MITYIIIKYTIYITYISIIYVNKIYNNKIGRIREVISDKINFSLMQ